MTDTYQQLDATTLRDLLARHRGNLRHLEAQAAVFGSGQEPLAVRNQLDDEQRTLAAILAEYGRRGQAAPPPDAAPDLVGSVGAMARDGLGALAALLGNAAVRGAVAAFRTDFEATCAQIVLVSGYKRMHDLLQQLEDCNGLLFFSGRSLASDANAWEILEREGAELERIVDGLQRVAAGQPFSTNESLWMRRLDRARAELVHAIAGGDGALIGRATTSIADDVLGREFSRVNSRLITAARALRLAALVQALTTIGASLAALQLDATVARQFDLFKNGVGALAQLDAALSALMICHDTFQEIDNELRYAKDLLDDDAAGLPLTWQDIKPLAAQLCMASQAVWALKLSEHGAALDVALAGGNVMQIRRAFLRYRNHAVLSFNQVDHDLLALCDQLQAVGEPLTAVLELIA